MASCVASAIHCQHSLATLKHTWNVSWMVCYHWPWSKLKAHYIVVSLVTSDDHTLHVYTVTAPLCLHQVLYSVETQLQELPFQPHQVVQLRPGKRKRLQTKCPIKYKGAEQYTAATVAIYVHTNTHIYTHTPDPSLLSPPCRFRPVGLTACDSGMNWPLFPYPIATQQHTVYWEILAAIKFREIARNCLDKYLVNLKLGNSHDQIESYDVITRTEYAYSHFSLVTARSQKMETYEVDSCVHGHHVFWGIWNPIYRQGRDNRPYFPLEKCHLWSLV